MDFIDNRLDVSTGTLRSRAVIPNKDLSILPGQFGRVRLIGSSPYEALLIPDTAIASDQSFCSGTAPQVGLLHPIYSRDIATPYRAQLRPKLGSRRLPSSCHNKIGIDLESRSYGFQALVADLGVGCGSVMDRPREATGGDRGYSKSNDESHHG